MYIALIGHSGFWGQKLEKVATRLGWHIERYDSKNTYGLEDSDADAAVIATPPHTHFPLVKRCLDLGMDVFVEKPMCMSSAHIRELDAIARKMGAVIFVDSTFLYSESFYQLLRMQEDVLCYQSQRLSPPLPSACINAGWDMIWHDLAILDGLGALGVSDGVGVVDGALATAAMPLPSGGSAFIMASRFWPSKIREIVINMPSGDYVWDLQGLRTIFANEYLAKESQETLESALIQFEICCKDRKLFHLTDSSHALRVTLALEHLFPGNNGAHPCSQLKKSLAN